MAEGKAEAARILSAHVDSTLGARRDAIYAAAQSERLDIVRAWLDSGGDIEAKNGEGETMLHAAATAKMAGTLDYL